MYVFSHRTHYWIKKIITIRFRLSWMLMNSCAKHSPVQQTLPDMGIAGIPLLCVQLPHHILCVHLLLLCQQPFSYGINIFRWYVVRMMLWRPGKCHPCQVEAEGATKHRRHWQCLRVLLSQSNTSLTLHFSFSVHVFPSPTILCQFCLVSLVQGSEERNHLIEEGHWDFWTICCGLAPWLGPMCAAAV